MSKVTLEQAKTIINRLTLNDKVRLVRGLERQTSKVRWARLWADLDQRRKGRRFTMAQIQREIDAVRCERRGVNHSRRR